MHTQSLYRLPHESDDEVLYFIFLILLFLFLFPPLFTLYYFFLKEFIFSWHGQFAWCGPVCVREIEREREIDK